MKRLLMQLSYAMTVCLIFLLSPVTVSAADNTISEAELDQMLAPIALYPDTVLTHILIASTYPLEVVQADRWAKRNKKLSSQAAIDAVEDENWDPSVKALIAFPQILARLSDDLSWTEQLGEAFLQDEAEVLSRVQLLRQKADKQGSLNDTQHVVVERDRNVIIIEPARKEVIYVPVYDTRVVYGNWWWPAYPPVYWQNVGGHYTNNSFSWGVSVNVNPWFYFGVFDWQQRHIIVNHNYYYAPPRYYPRRRVHFTNSNRWYHDSYHRRGVHYRNPRLNNQYQGGYGPKQYTREYKGTREHTSTREYKGQPNRGYRQGDSATRETRPVNQRRTAQQVVIPSRNEPNRTVTNRIEPNRVVPNRTAPERNNVQHNQVINRRDQTTTRELRAVPRDRIQPIDKAQPVQRTQRQVVTTSPIREQQPIQQRSVQQTRPIQQARTLPERQTAKPAVRESRPQAQRQTVTSRRQDHRSID